MRVNSYFVLLAIVGTALTMPTAAQLDRCRAWARSVHSPANSAHFPYTVEYRATVLLEQPDGTSKTFETIDTFAYVEQGRKLASSKYISSSEDPLPPTLFCVYDSATGLINAWNVPGKKVFETKIAADEPWHSPCAKKTTSAEAETVHTKPLVTDLGMEPIQGYQARGFKVARSVTTHKGEENKIVERSVETWVAFVPAFHSLVGINYVFRLQDPFHYNPWAWNNPQKLEYFDQHPPAFFSTAEGRTGLMVRQVLDSPQHEKTTSQLERIDSGEPDAILFLPPTDYEMTQVQAPHDECHERNGENPPPSPPVNGGSSHLH